MVGVEIDTSKVGKTRTAAGWDWDRPDALQYWGCKDPDLDRQANQRMVRDIRAHPVRLLKKIGLNAVEFYVPTIHDALMGSRKGAAVVGYAALISLWNLAYLGLVAVGLWRVKDRKLRGRLWLAIGCLAVLIGFYLPFIAMISHARYAVASLPVLAALAAAGVVGNPKEASIPESTACGSETWASRPQKADACRG